MKVWLVECREASVLAIFASKEVAIESVKATHPMHTATIREQTPALFAFEPYTLVSLAGFVFVIREMTPRTDVEQL